MRACGPPRNSALYWLCLCTHIGSSLMSYSPTTQEFLAKWSLQAITLYYLREDEVMLLERERPGAQLAWKEIVQRDRPAAPVVPFLFKPENYWSEPAQKQPPSSSSSRAKRTATRVPRA